MPDGTLLLSGSGRLLTPAPYEGPGPWAITVERGGVIWVGARDDAPRADDTLELGDALVTPGLVDAHTHPVYAGDRSDEAAARLAGEPYSGGGILRTVAATRAASDTQLEELVEARLRRQLAAGTTTVECKSGYGLSTEEELRHLRVIGRVAERLPVRVVRTLLGAHARPGEVADYVGEVVDRMIPAVAAEGLAEFCDVFCDEGFFTVAEAERILGAAAASGLALRIHADQLSAIGASGLAAKLAVTSADHLEQLDGPDLEALAGSGVVATLLPGPALVMRDRLPPARRLLDAGATLALASDANAGTFGAWGAMPLVIGLACVTLQMTALEAVAAATAGGAAALALSGRRGTIAPGADADIVAWDADHEGAFALRLGAVAPRHVLIGGEVVLTA
ncbi:MAG TPA: imidazolonepropionase [Candidatus Limnocylindria bacterium]|nr:imidazolonepropionase [Candidatus Limnocylindria bacterium]